MKAALYIRVSTHHQIDKDSLPFQRKELINYAKYALNIEDYEVFEDAGYSAKNTDRPQYQHMMKRIREKEFTHLVVWKIDRISRNLKDFTEMYDELRSCGITFVSKNEQFDTSTAMGEAMLQIILVFAELERKLTAERVFSIMLSRAEKGLWNGATVPLGYVWSDEKKFPVVDPKESEVVRYIYKLYLQHGSTLKVASILNSEDVRTKRDGTWRGKTIRDILRNPFYIGTYRYNMRDNSTGKYGFKDKSEWIVLDDNHEGIIEKSTFKQANDMLSKNYKGLNDVRRANTNIHVFAKKVFCHNCDDLLTSGRDSARKDGYQPSRYTCNSYHRHGVESSCNNFISDITLGPFVINYIANLIRMQDSINSDATIQDMERNLLRGSVFNKIVGIDDASLKETYAMLFSGYERNEFENQTDDVVDHADLQHEKLQRDKSKYEKALARLDDLYLFDEEGISKKDYITKKSQIMAKLEETETTINSALNKSASRTSDVFVDKAKYFLITKEILQSRSVDFRRLLDTVGSELLAEFISSVIEEIKVSDKLVHSIKFKNGITHNFVHKPLEKEIRAMNYKYPENGAYRQHFDNVIDYVKSNGSITRVEVENLVNIKRHSALTLLNELIATNKLERKRESVAIKYYLK